MNKTFYTIADYTNDFDKANEICNSFDLNVVSPKTPKEFEYLKDSLTNYKASTWNEMSFGEYRPEYKSAFNWTADYPKTEACIGILRVV